MVTHSCPLEDCKATFSRPSRLRIHIQRHQGIKGFQCNQCDRGFHRRQHLKRHVAEVHQNQSRLEQPLFCDHCDRQFSTTWGLRRHQAKIKKPKTRTRQYSCETCGHSFFNNDDLKRHTLAHERFKCVIPSCPMLTHQFSWTYYNKHMIEYHSNPFQCAHCDKQFLIKSQIRKHVRQHMPKFRCTEPGCNRTFISAKNVIYHIRVGHGERLFKCDVPECDWKFKYKACLNKHIKAHHENRRIVPMANRINKTKEKEPKYLMANKLATLALKM